MSQDIPVCDNAIAKMPVDSGAITEAVLSEHIRHAIPKFGGDQISLRALRGELEVCTGGCLLSWRSFIKKLALHTVYELTEGITLEQLPEDRLEAIRNPCIGFWQPCCDAYVGLTRTLPCKTHGHWLFTDLHDLDDTSAIVVGGCQGRSGIAVESAPAWSECSCWPSLSSIVNLSSSAVGAWKPVPTALAALDRGRNLFMSCSDMTNGTGTDAVEGHVMPDWGITLFLCGNALSR